MRDAGLVALGVLWGFGLASVCVYAAVSDYDRTQRVFTALVAKYGQSFERRPTP